MSDEKHKPVGPIFYTLHNFDTHQAFQSMELKPRDADVLNKVFIKHKIPLKFTIEQ